MCAPHAQNEQDSNRKLLIIVWNFENVSTSSWFSTMTYPKTTFSVLLLQWIVQTWYRIFPRPFYSQFHPNHRNDCNLRYISVVRESKVRTVSTEHVRNFCANRYFAQDQLFERNGMDRARRRQLRNMGEGRQAGSDVWNSQTGWRVSGRNSRHEAPRTRDTKNLIADSGSWCHSKSTVHSTVSQFAQFWRSRSGNVTKAIHVTKTNLTNIIGKTAENTLNQIWETWSATTSRCNRACRV